VELHSRIRWRGNFLHYPAFTLPICWCSCTQLENASNKKSIVHILSLKEGFCGVYVTKGTYVENKQHTICMLLKAKLTRPLWIQ